jgi:hypothetical protein
MHHYLEVEEVTEEEAFEIGEVVELKAAKTCWLSAP